MSDQPKPRKQDAATPTAGEWTAQQRQVFNSAGIIGNAHNESEAIAIADAHNAALDDVIAESASGLTEQKLANQLAAERELLGAQIEATAAARLRASVAEKQLAAERERADSRTIELEQMAGRYNRDAAQLRSQLAAAHATEDELKRQLAIATTTALDAAISEAQKPLVELLERIVTDDTLTRGEIIFTVKEQLAKVKEVK